MRSVSYVQRVALEFSGSLFPHAICLGDVDNDTVSACALRDAAGLCSSVPGGAGQGSRGAALGVRVAPARWGWGGGSRGLGESFGGGFLLNVGTELPRFPGLVFF